MAKLIPDSALSDSSITAGEKKILRLLHRNLEDNAYIWYQPKLSDSRRPDIIIYLPEIGIVLYEVKDWYLSKIKNANADFWEIQGEDKSFSETCPFKKARTYFYNLKNMLAQHPEFLSSKQEFAGKLKIPIATGVILTNIDKQSFIKRKFNTVIEEKYIIFHDDIEQLGSSFSESGILQLMKNHFDPWWPNNELDEAEMNLLRSIIYPEITAVQKDKGGQHRTIVLDEYQEQVAKKIGSGHRVVRGIAGSGKSLVICAKARLLIDEHPDWKILITCFNISLASQLRYYLSSFHSYANDKDQINNNLIHTNIKIIHFHAFCQEILKKAKEAYPIIKKQQVMQTAGFSSLSADEREARFDEMQSALIGNKIQEIALTKSVHHYDAILIDESQDFHPSWLKALLLFVNGNTNFILLAEDPNQKIYPRSFSYKEAGIDVVGGGRVFSLPVGYRSTREIVLPASKLVVTSKWDSFYKKFIEEAGEDILKPKFISNGKFPEIIVKRHYEDICEFIVEDIKTKLTNGFNYADFGIVYLTKNKKSSMEESQQKLFNDNDDVDYVNTLCARFAASSIPYFWLCESQEKKKQYDQFQNRVTISTLFSVKGLEFDVVYLVGLELYPWKLRNKRENASMIYVGMTRAKTEVYLMSTVKTELLYEIETIISDLKNNTAT